MIKTFRGPVVVPFVLLVAACTVERKDDAAVDTPAATNVIAPPPPELPAPQPPPPSPKKASVARDSTRSSKAVVKSTAKKPADTLERDSAIQPTFVIGADGKIRPIKKK